MIGLGLESLDLGFESERRGKAPEGEEKSGKRGEDGKRGEEGKRGEDADL